MGPRIGQWGNSLAVRLPRALADQTGLSRGLEVRIRVIEGAVVITPVGGRSPDIGPLMARMTPETSHSESDWGPWFPWQIR